MGNKSVLKIQRVRTNLLLALMSAAVLTTVFGSHTFAQSTGASSADNVLKVSPLRTDVTIAAGTSKEVEVTVTNLTASPLTVDPIENDFIAGDENGTPALILNANSYAPTHSLKRFMTPLTDVTIAGDTSKTIDVLITVPKTAQAGGYFGAVRFEPTIAGSGGQVNLSANVASLILLTVPGPAVEKLNLTDFDIQQNNITGAYFQTPKNLSAYIRFQNEGNLQESPFGVVDIKNGNKEVYEANFNVAEPRDVILPDSARHWQIPLEHVGTFGHYTVTATLAYGQDNQTIEITKSFWVIPLYVIIGAIVALLVLIGIIILIIFAIRRRRRRYSTSRRHGFGSQTYRR